MALLDSEVARVRHELGYASLTASAEPYISYVSRFAQIIQPYLSTGASTTSSSAVTAATTATPATLVLSSATGFAAGNRVWIDVDDRQESGLVESISGSSIVVLLTNAHSGTYPVTVEAGESIVREILLNIKAVKAKMATAYGTGALKAVDEIEFYDSMKRSYFGGLGDQLRFWRGELACACGTASVWDMMRGGGGAMAVY